MAIASTSDLTAAMVSGAYDRAFDRPSAPTMVVGELMHHWRGTGFPAQGAIPGAAAVCDAALTGAFPLAPRSGGQQRVLSQLLIQMATVGHSFRIEDRLMHMGGLNGTLTTAQTVNVDLNANLAVANLAERIGAANYSEVVWYLDWYTATGATITTPTINVTYHDGTTGTAGILTTANTTSLPASIAASRRYKIVGTSGKYIRDVDSVQLSASTGTAGSFGVTAVRPRAAYRCQIASIEEVRDAFQLHLPQVFDNSCLTFSQLCNNTTSGGVAGMLKQAVN